MKRFLMLWFLPVLALVCLFPMKAEAAPSAPLLSGINGQYNSPIYGASTTANITLMALSVGDSLLVYDNAALVNSVAIGATTMTVTINGLTEASHPFNVRVMNSIGETSGLSNSMTYIPDLVPPAKPNILFINGGTSPESSASNNARLSISNLSTNDYLTVFDQGTTVVSNILATGSTATINLSAIVQGAHSYQVTTTDRAGNVSTLSDPFSYTVTSDSPSVLAAARFLGNPLAEGVFMNGRYADPHSYPRNIWDMQVFDGKIYFGSGNSSNSAPDSNWGPVSLWYYDLGSTDFKMDRVINQVGATTNYVDEEQVDKFRVVDGTLWTPGHDPRDDWSFGNMYRYDGNNIWTKLRNIPDGIHDYDIISFNGKLYASIGAGDTTNILESTDNGLSWRGVSGGSGRVYDLFVLNNTLYGEYSIGYHSNPLANTIYKFNGSTFDLYSTSGINLIPGATKNVPTVYYDDFRMFRVTNFNNILLYGLAHPNNDHQWTPIKFYKTTDMVNGTLINLGDGAITYDIKVDGSTVYVLATKKLSDTSYINYVYSSTDTNTWKEVLHFPYQTYALSFEENNNDFYFGMGTGHPPGSMEDNVDVAHLSAKSGDILEIKRPDYLAIQPIISSINGSTGPLTTNQTTANILVTNLDTGSSITVYDGVSPLISKIAVGVTDTVIVYGLTLGSHDLTVKATNPGRNSTAVSSAFTYIVQTNAPLKPTVLLPVGTYYSNISVGLSVSDTAAHTYYMVGGSIPDQGSSEYLGPITINFSEGTIAHLKAISYDIVGNSSPIESADYAFDTVTPTEVNSNNLSSLADHGAFIGENNEPLTVGTSVGVALDLAIVVPSGGGNHQISIQKNTEISRTDGTALDVGQLVAVPMATGDVGEIANHQKVAVLKWGLMGAGLEFSLPIQVTIDVGSSYDGKTLTIYRSVNGTNDWTTDGIVAPGTCVVSGGSCSFHTTKASYYAPTEDIVAPPTPAPTAVPTSTPSSNNSNNNQSQSSSNPGPQVCNNEKPASAPKILSIERRKDTIKGKELVKLLVQPAANPVTYYYIAYDTVLGGERYGTEIGYGLSGNSLTFQVGNLSPKAKYYFKIRAGNGCMPGPWSDSQLAKTGLYSIKATKVTVTTNTSVKKALINTVKKVISKITPKQETIQSPLAENRPIPTAVPMPTVEQQPAIQQQPTIVQQPTVEPIRQEVIKKKKCFIWWCW